MVLKAKGYLFFWRERMKIMRTTQIFGFLVSLGMTSLSLAAVTTGASAPTVNTQKANNPVHLLSQRSLEQMVQVQRDVKAGKLTKDQGKTLQTQIKAVHVQEVTSIKQNGTHQLTVAQYTQLNGQLDALSKQIP